MTNPNEHSFILKEFNNVETFKRKRIGDGVSLLLAKTSDKMDAQAYHFDSKKYTYDEAKEYMNKIRVEYMASEKAVTAKLSMKAANGKPEVDGRIWSAGVHHVFVNNKPAKIYVPEETIMQTFDSIKGLIKDQGRMPMGIDHLSDDMLSENEILAKMNLLDVGNVTKVGTDGNSIYILDSEITNDAIKGLNSVGELPAYSIVGAMDAKPCPTGKADYVVNSIDVERVDFVQEGGCQVCKVGAQPDSLILTSSSSEMEEDNVTNEVEQTPVEETPVVDEAPVEEVPTEEPVVETPVEEPTEEVEEPAEEEEEEPEEEVSELDSLKKEIAELKEMLGGKKPKVAAKKSDAVQKLIQAGKALPKQRKSLEAFEKADPEAFEIFAKAAPVVVKVGMEAKLAKIEEQTKVRKPKKISMDDPEWYESEEYKQMLAQMGL
jgi:hypothetical protein